MVNYIIIGGVICVVMIMNNLNMKILCKDL